MLRNLKQLRSPYVIFSIRYHPLQSAFWILLESLLLRYVIGCARQEEHSKRVQELEEGLRVANSEISKARQDSVCVFVPSSVLSPLPDAARSGGVELD